MKPELLDWLVEVDAYLYDHEDVVDGNHGEQLPNRAMKLRQELAELVPVFRDPRGKAVR